MSFRNLVSCLLMLGAGSRAYAQEAASSPVEVKNGVAQLFIDDFLIESQAGLKRTLHQPKKDNDGNTPLLSLEEEYHGFPATLQANGTIVFDPRLKKYVMFGMGFAPTFTTPVTERVRIYRFTSTDGMNWIKGDDGRPQHIPIDLTDAASGATARNTDLFSFYYDTKDAAYPYKGWLFFSLWAGGLDGTYYVRSADGIKWERVRRLTSLCSHEIMQNGHKFCGPGDVTTFYHDPVTDRFIGSLRFFTRDGAGPDKKNLLRAKAFIALDRMDEPLEMKRVRKLDIVPAGAAANGDLPDDEYYSATTWRYESIWLGGLKIWHGSGNYPYSAAGSAFLKLMVSRDGLNWKKVPFSNEAGQPEVFIPNGSEGGNGGRNDGGYLTEFSNAPLRIGDELIYYYGCSSFGKNQADKVRVTGGGIFRARLRPEGFVSVDGGSLLTKPLHLEGKNLFINAGGDGLIAVTALDADHHVLGNATVRGDSLRHAVSFEGKPLASLAPSGIVRLRFAVGGKSEIYSFNVR